MELYDPRVKRDKNSNSCAHGREMISENFTANYERPIEHFVRTCRLPRALIAQWIRRHYANTRMMS